MASKPRSSGRKAKRAAVKPDAEAKSTAPAQEQAVKPDFKAEVARLAELDALEYDRIRDGEAKRLCVRVKALDEAVKAHRKAKAAADKPKSKAHLRLAASNGKPTAAKAPRRDMFAPADVHDWPSASPISGEPHTNDIRNVKAVFDAAGVQLRNDAFTGKSVATFNGKNTALDDGVNRRFWLMLQNSGLRATYQFACEAIVALSWECTFDSAIDFFNSLPKWDGVTRAETLLIDELGAEDTPYTRGATRLLFASLIRRGMGRESKCDEFVILRGPQRLGKSSLFKFLIGEDLFQENLKMSHSTRDLLELTLGKLVVEMAELSGMKKADRDDVKNFFSRTFDEFSLKHEKHATRRQRRFTFIGTANDETPIANMLEEDRRFIIIPVTKRADLNRIKHDRLQILAEAIEIEKAYGAILELHEELRPEACKSRSKVVARPQYEDPLTEAFGDIVAAKIKVSDVYAFLGLRDHTAIGRYTSSTGGVTPIMERLGWRRAQSRRAGKPEWAFIKGGANGGWLCPVWPHGYQAPADIVPDAEINPDFDPEYRVVTEGVTGGCDTENPCGSSTAAAVTTRNNPMSEIKRRQYSTASYSGERSGNVEGGISLNRKVCGDRVVTPAETRISTSGVKDLEASQPSSSQASDTRPSASFTASQANDRNGSNGGSRTEGGKQATRGTRTFDASWEGRL